MITTSRFCAQEKKSLLDEFQWVTDDVIYVYSKIVNSKICKNNSRIYFLCPTVTIGIRILEDFEPLLLEGEKLILLPISNSSKVQFVGPGNGSHWSLLLCDRKTGNNFYHINSLNDYNLQHAKRICEKINSFFLIFLQILHY